MSRSVRLLCLLLLMVGAILVLLLSQPDGADASGHSATRSFASPSVDPEDASR